MTHCGEKHRRIVIWSPQDSRVRNEWREIVYCWMTSPPGPIYRFIDNVDNIMMTERIEPKIIDKISFKRNACRLFAIHDSMLLQQHIIARRQQWIHDGPRLMREFTHWSGCGSFQSINMSCKAVLCVFAQKLRHHNIKSDKNFGSTHKFYCVELVECFVKFRCKRQTRTHIAFSWWKTLWFFTRFDTPHIPRRSNALNACNERRVDCEQAIKHGCFCANFNNHMFYIRYHVLAAGYAQRKKDDLNACISSN